MPGVECYAFVDGDHVRRYFNEAMREFYGHAPALNPAAVRSWARAQRLFWYDSVDESQRPGEAPDEAAARIASHKANLDAVNEAHGCHVRLGLVTGRKPRRQKGVDVLLAVEMLTHAFKGSFNRAVLVAGDLDFKPLVEAVVNTGTLVEVGYFKLHAARRLLDAADSRRELTFDTLHEWCAPEFLKANPLPQSSISGQVERQELVVASGNADGLPARLVRLPDARFEIVVDRYHQGNSLYVGHVNRELLVRFFPRRHGNLALEAV